MIDTPAIPLAIARAVYFGARVLILDEPTSALGAHQSGIVLKYIVQARELGKGVTFITHNPHHAYPVGDRFYLVERGRLMASMLKDETTVEGLTDMMTGGAELAELSKELMGLTAGVGAPDAEVARELAIVSTGRRQGGQCRPTLLPPGRARGRPRPVHTPGSRWRLSHTKGPTLRPGLRPEGVAPPGQSG